MFTPWSNGYGSDFVLVVINILHAFKEVNNYNTLLNDPGVGASWEGFVIEQIINASKETTQAYFYRTQQGAECDLLLEKNGEIIACIEVKLSSSPKLSKGFRISMKDTKAQNAYVIASVNETFQIDSSITVTSLPLFIKEILPTIL